MNFRPWKDALELSVAARGPATAGRAWRMMRTDAWLILVLFRIRKAVLRLRIPFVNRVLRLMQMMFAGVELGNDVELGDGVYFIHSLGTVVGGDAHVGHRVRFYGNNTVGTANNNGYPVIEDDVEVGCGARILGPVRIGARSFIGANAVVLEDVPADSVAVGAPARVVRRAGSLVDALSVQGRRRPLGLLEAV
jgi:serine O-acetyltransferase